MNIYRCSSKQAAVMNGAVVGDPPPGPPYLFPPLPPSAWLLTCPSAAHLPPPPPRAWLLTCPSCPSMASRLNSSPLRESSTGSTSSCRGSKRRRGRGERGRVYDTGGQFFLTTQSMFHRHAVSHRQAGNRTHTRSRTHQVYPQRYTTVVPAPCRPPRT